MIHLWRPLTATATQIRTQMHIPTRPFLNTAEISTYSFNFSQTTKKQLSLFFQLFGKITFF